MKYSSRIAVGLLMVQLNNWAIRHPYSSFFVLINYHPVINVTLDPIISTGDFLSTEGFNYLFLLSA